VSRIDRTRAGRATRTLATRLLPESLRHWARRIQRRYRLQWPRRGNVQFGTLHRLSPLSSAFGLDRGLPIDRYYIEQFLARHADDIQGHVLEMGDDAYTRWLGGARVTAADVLDVTERNKKATIVADLTRADVIPSNRYDCVVCTQTLQMIYDLRAALRHLHRVLKPGGRLLATAGGIARIGRREGRDAWGEYWRFTSQSARLLFGEFFPAPGLVVEVYGNVLSAVAFLHGLAAEELSRNELDCRDPDFEVLVAVRASKARLE